MPGSPLILCYHALSPTWPADIAARPDEFEKQISHLVDKGWQAVTFSDALSAKGNGKVVSITFDDAFTSVFDLAFPILERYSLIATLFVPTRFVDSDEPMVWDGTSQWLELGHRDELRCMSSAQIRRLADSGWEIGAHSYDHPHLTTVDDSEVERQLRSSKERCEEITGDRCRSFAYPYGDADGRVERAVAAAHFESAAGLDPDLSRSSRFYRPRSGIYRGDDFFRFRLKSSRVVRGLRGRHLARLRTKPSTKELR